MKYYIKKIVIVLNIFAFIYFIILLLMAYTSLRLEIIEVVGKLITFPLLLFILISFVVSAIQLARGKKTIFYKRVAQISGSILALQILATIVDLFLLT
ncbi:MAG: hypothetical protein JJT94_01710 [Bernardetiaceae bacterium]|nr:hypothetical protein [Bernardetiaceae bacterium]